MDNIQEYPHKDLGGLIINKAGNFETETQRECTTCHKIFDKRKVGCRMKICKPCNTERVKSQTIEKKMWRRAKNRAKVRGRVFDIEVEDILLPTVCPVFGFPLRENKGRSGAFFDSYSLDRIDNDKGYVQGNIQVISQLANAMKADASVEQLLKFSRFMLKQYGDTGED